MLPKLSEGARPLVIIGEIHLAITSFSKKLNVFVYRSTVTVIFVTTIQCSTTAPRMKPHALRPESFKIDMLRRSIIICIIGLTNTPHPAITQDHARKLISGAS